MSEPSLPLQKIVVARLKSDPDIQNEVGERVYDRAPHDVVFPYIQVGLFDILDDSNECHDAFDCIISVDVWSRAVGQVEAKRIASKIHSSLHRYYADMSGDGFDFVGEIEHESSRVRGDGDGVTTRVIISFKVFIERL